MNAWDLETAGEILAPAPMLSTFSSSSTGISQATAPFPNPHLPRPHWHKLSQVVSTRMQHLSPQQVIAGVMEYQRFLALVILCNDFESQVYSPSPDIGQIWQIHLAMMEDYKEDLFAFCHFIHVARALRAWSRFPLWPKSRPRRERNVRTKS